MNHRGLLDGLLNTVSDLLVLREELLPEVLACVLHSALQLPHVLVDVGHRFRGRSLRTLCAKVLEENEQDENSNHGKVNESKLVTALLSRLLFKLSHTLRYLVVRLLRLGCSPFPSLLSHLLLCLLHQLGKLLLRHLAPLAHLQLELLHRHIRLLLHLLARLLRLDTQLNGDILQLGRGGDLSIPVAPLGNILSDLVLHLLDQITDLLKLADLPLQRLGLGNLLAQSRHLLLQLLLFHRSQRSASRTRKLRGRRVGRGRSGGTDRGGALAPPPSNQRATRPAKHSNPAEHIYSLPFRTVDPDEEGGGEISIKYRN
eukprot:Hpha_TRINITY_DN15706_c1_g1::TRINITY_DN15706_c1_g1_i1::g.37516::m.37516